MEIKSEINYKGFDGVILFKRNNLFYPDSRGAFEITWNKEIEKTIEKSSGNKFDVIQEQTSESKQNVFRGFHWQRPHMFHEYGSSKITQAKYIYVTTGFFANIDKHSSFIIQKDSVLIHIPYVVDFFIDIRKNSPTFLKIGSVKLLSGVSLYLPEGFAHGYYVPQFFPSDSIYNDHFHINFHYKVNGYYSRTNSRTLHISNIFKNNHNGLSITPNENDEETKEQIKLLQDKFISNELIISENDNHNGQPLSNLYGDIVESF